jgi:hypothetical protein
VFDGVSDLPLVFRTEAGAFRGDNLKLPRSKFTENFDVFVINGGYFFLAGDASHNENF